jgi:hypothetical protein
VAFWELNDRSILNGREWVKFRRSFLKAYALCSAEIEKHVYVASCHWQQASNRRHRLNFAGDQLPLSLCCRLRISGADRTIEDETDEHLKNAESSIYEIERRLQAWQCGQTRRDSDIGHIGKGLQWGHEDKLILVQQRENKYLSQT